jgi:hypothetical protein
MIKTNRINWIKRFKFSEDHVWKSLFTHFLKKCDININFLLFADFDIISIQKAKASKSTIPEYAETLKYWSEMVECSIPKENYLWYNKTITKNKIPFFYKAFQQIEINYIADLTDPDETIIPFRKLENKGLSRTEWFKWYSLTSIIKKEL